MANCPSNLHNGKVGAFGAHRPNPQYLMTEKRE
jgi:hypothetical protein